MLDPITYYHKYVEEGAYAPSSILNNGNLYLHDTNEGIIVTFEKLNYAKLTAKKYNGVIEKTPIGTYRIIKNINNN